VDFLELGGCEHVLVAVEYLDLVREAELLEQPDDTLSAGVVEPACLSQYGSYAGRKRVMKVLSASIPVKLEPGLSYWFRHN
jgi:hypothetical protein